MFGAQQFGHPAGVQFLPAQAQGFDMNAMMNMIMMIVMMGIMMGMVKPMMERAK